MTSMSMSMSKSKREEEENLEQASDTLSEEQLMLLKGAIEEAQSDADAYLYRNKQALDWCRAKWPGQWNDGRKWPLPGEYAESVLPWIGCADTRDRLVEFHLREHVAVAMFAAQNMKVQAQSTHPLLTTKLSQQMTTLLNWQLFIHMKGEMHRELSLAFNWNFIYGSSIIAVDWEQEMRLYQETITVMTLQAWLAEGGGGGGLGNVQRPTSNVQRPMEVGMPMGAESLGMGGDAPTLEEMAEMIMDDSYEEDVIALIQSMSPIMTKAEGRRALNDLRQIRYAEIKVPDIFKSKPRVMALRPGVDVLFDKELDDPQNATRIIRVERITETILRDRIQTAGYDPVFVDEALERKGDVTNEYWQNQTMSERTGAFTVYPNNRGGGLHTRLSGARARAGVRGEELVELYHVQSLQHDRGVPVLMDTVLHMAVDRVGKHGPCGYDHGKINYHGLRMEYQERAFLSSEGIPEKAYTWEQEAKWIADNLSDRNDLATMPPMVTDSYEEVQKIKAAYMPKTLFPIKRHGSIQFLPPPPYDPGAVRRYEIVMAKARDYFGLFGADVDPDKKQMNRNNLGAALMTQLHPVIMMIGQLNQQLLPDEVVAQVGGPSAQPMHVSRKEIQGQFLISCTIEMRMLDKEFLGEYVKFATQLAGMDSLGITDRTEMIRTGAELFSIDFAERVIKDPQPATEAERQDEIKALDLILASGVDQATPKAGNFQLRLQAGQQHVQELLSTNPVVQRRVQQNPEIMEVIQNRWKGFQGQLQQTENAQIGRMMTTKTFTNEAPVAQAQLGSGG